MSDLEVALQPPYPVRLRVTFAQAWEALRADHGARRWFIVADRTLVERCPGALRPLSAAERRAAVLLRGGEAVKSWRTVRRLTAEARSRGVDRDTLLVAVGGGTVGDAAGFFAATYMRGIAWCPLATTTIALADSAIGGKTALNAPGVKNLIGAFHQPVGVYGAMEALGTLPARHLRSGAAEVVKCAAIGDEALFAWLEGAVEELRRADRQVWEHALSRAAALKAQLVAQDPREQGVRALLNFGHTIGHALEAVVRPRLLHGEAVSLGMIAASWVAEQNVLAAEGTADRIRSLLGRLELPVWRPGLSVRSVMNAIGYDKKVRLGQVRMVLTSRIGAATSGHLVDRPTIDRALRSLSVPPTRHGAAPARSRKRARPSRPTRGAGR